MTDIAIINASRSVKDDEARKCVAALQKQVSRDFQPFWGVDAALHFFTGKEAQAKKVPSGMWWLAILDDSDTAGALGYHDITKEGLPLGKAFAGTDIKNGLSWTTTVSHELLEMLGDPDINLTVLTHDKNQGDILVAYETCDACEDDRFGYRIDGVLVSDFVTPAWFETFRKPRSTPFDFQKRITQPFQLLSGGYIGILPINATGGWQQITAREILGDRRHTHRSPRGAVGSRRERRNVPRSKWMECTVGGSVLVGPGGVTVGGTITCR